MSEDLKKLAALARLFVLADDGHHQALNDAQMVHCWKLVDERWTLKQDAKKNLLAEIEKAGL